MSNTPNLITANAGYATSSPTGAAAPSGSTFGYWGQDTVNSPGIWKWYATPVLIGDITPTPIQAPPAVIGPQPADPATGKPITVSTNATTGQTQISGTLQTPLGPSNSPQVVFRNPA
jgi:hypothetical protein